MSFAWVNTKRFTRHCLQQRCLNPALHLKEWLILSWTVHSGFLGWRVRDETRIFFGAILFTQKCLWNLIFPHTVEVNQQEAVPWFWNPQPLPLPSCTWGDQIDTPQGSDTSCFFLFLSWLSASFTFWSMPLTCLLFSPFTSQSVHQALHHLGGTLVTYPPPLPSVQYSVWWL